jgi:hypothetical protein
LIQFHFIALSRPIVIVYGDLWFDQVHIGLLIFQTVLLLATCIDDVITHCQLKWEPTKFTKVAETRPFKHSEYIIIVLTHNVINPIFAGGTMTFQPSDACLVLIAGPFQEH